MRLTNMTRTLAGVLRRVHPHAAITFSQEGEDLVLARLFDDRRRGFYVDVGAHHPTRFSNTYRFYLQGWRGINLDPAADFARQFAHRRPRDVNLNWAVGTPAGERTFFEFNEPALNTFDPHLAAERDGLRDYRIVRRRTVPVRPLADVLRDHLPPGERITFLTVDAEGLDLQVLMSNDWTAYRPEAVVAEFTVGVTVDNLLNCPVASFLASVGYTALSKLVRSAVFVPTSGRGAG